MMKMKEIPIALESKKISVIILFVIAISILIFQNHQFGFDIGHHGYLSSHGAVLSKNISMEKGFLMYETALIDNSENITYQTYSRFPVTAFVLIKAFMNIFSPDMSMEILIARQLMNLFFIGAIVFTYLSVHELTKNIQCAISVTLLSFSSFYMNYYNDMIFNDTPTLFGFILSYHGIILYHLYNRKMQMFVKAIIGLSLGWQVLSMLLAYILCSFFTDFLKFKSIVRLVRSDQFKLGLISLVFAISLLGFNFINESLVTGKPIAEIGSLHSAISRIGQNNVFQKQYDEYLEWGGFLKEQLRRIGAMAIPYVIKNSGDFRIPGALILIASLAGCCILQNKTLLFTFILSGFLWVFPMKGYTFSHDYQSIYYIGIPVLFFLLILGSIKKKLPVILPLVVFFSIIIFLSTNIIFNKSKAQASAKVNLVTLDFQNIIDYTEKENIFFIDGLRDEIAYGYHAVEYYLSGNYFTMDKNFAEYIISRNREFNSFLLTPKNSTIFLFRGKPHFAAAFNRRGVDHYNTRKFDEAIQDFNHAIEKKPDFVEAYVNRGIAFNKLGAFDQAAIDYNKALVIEPESLKAINNLAWFLSTCPDSRYRDGKKALRLAEKGVELNPGAYNLDTLAAAYAENDNFRKAVETQKEALRLSRNESNKKLMTVFERHLIEYKAGKALRDKQ